MDVAYHASHPFSRIGIETNGLLPGKSASYGPPAVYMFVDDYFAENYISDAPMDVWEVNVSGLKLYPDPEDPSGAVYSLDDFIDRDRIRFTGTFIRGEKMSEDDLFYALEAVEGDAPFRNWVEANMPHRVSELQDQLWEHLLLA